jgi:MoxR-vWA-beta-propeller ternary system domain bpX4
MILSSFINDLLTSGNIIIQGAIVDFAIDDEKQALILLKQYYNEDMLEMPLEAPAFNGSAALWSAKYFYNAIQFTLLRNELEEKINERLKRFEGEINASTIFSVDLMFRYLPSLFELTKGLAPSDVLVKILQQTASEWPFSSIGMEMEAVKNEAIVLENVSLKIMYIDRLMSKKDERRIIKNELQHHINISAGLHLNILWPNADIIKK